MDRLIDHLSNLNQKKYLFLQIFTHKRNTIRHKKRNEKKNRITYVSIYWYQGNPKTRKMISSSDR